MTPQNSNAHYNNVVFPVLLQYRPLPRTSQTLRGGMFIWRSFMGQAAPCSGSRSKVLQTSRCSSCGKEVTPQSWHVGDIAMGL